MWNYILFSVVAVVLVAVEGSYALGDSNYPLFNADDGLPSKVNEKLSEILALSEQQLKRIDAVDYK